MDRGSAQRLRLALLIVMTLLAILGAGFLAASAGSVPLGSAGQRAAALGSTAGHPEASERASAAVPTVLVIGDSTTVHMRRAFGSALRAAGLRATIDAKSGRTTHEGRAVLSRYRPDEYDYVVALLGANGRRANALRDMRALRALGVDTMATVQTPRQRAVNVAVRRVFGRERISWAGYAARHHIRTTDGKHYTTDDYRTRARYLAAQIARRAS